MSAHVLNLDGVVPAESGRKERDLPPPMPERNDLTRAHGMAAVEAQQDVQGFLCVRSCRDPPKTTYECRRTR